MIELIDRDYKIVIINMFEALKENVDIIEKWKVCRYEFRYR